MPRHEHLTASKKSSWSQGVLIAGTISLVLLLACAPNASAQSDYKTLHKFTGGADGDTPWAGVIFDQAGNLYGATFGGGGSSSIGTVFKLTPNADGSWTESVLYSFCSLTNCADGAGPIAGLIFDQAGNLYGAALGGGSGPFCIRTGGCGVVFELTPHSDGSWTESVLHDFCSLTNCTDGDLPFAGLIFDQTGNLYSTTAWGGITVGSCGSFGCGVVFKLTPNADGSWTESVLHSFCSFTNCVDGFQPHSALTFDANGNLYGTTDAGGRELTCSVPVGCGVVFKLTPNPDGSWTDNVLHRFAGKDGGFPAARVIFDQAGSLYSTTQAGGNLSKCSSSGCGVVFQLTPNADGSWKEKVLHRFTDGGDGADPIAGLIFDQAGNLYGSTLFSGNLSACSNGGCGLVFKLTPSSNGRWQETVLHTFFDHPGSHPFGDLIFDEAGNLYGTTQGDSTKTFGSVFEITP